jgi:hypothetical protein
MNNEQLARAIVAMFGLMANADNRTSPADVLLEETASTFWNRSECPPVEMAVHLWRAGWGVAESCGYAGVDQIAFWGQVRKMAFDGSLP